MAVIQGCLHHSLRPSGSHADVCASSVQEKALELHHYHNVNAFNEFDYSNRLAIWLQFIEQFDAEMDRSPHRSVQKAMRPDLPDWVRAQFYVNDGFDQWNEDKRLGALEEAEWGRAHIKRTQWAGVREELTDLLIHVRAFLRPAHSMHAGDLDRAVRRYAMQVVWRGTPRLRYEQCARMVCDAKCVAWHSCAALRWCHVSLLLRARGACEG